MSVESRAADQATGCRECAPEGGQFFNGDGVAISDAAARRLIREGGVVEAPHAGAGSWRAVARRLGMASAKAEDQTSSAGDWCFRVRGGRMLWQYNMWPRRGFYYTYGRAFG